VTVELPVVHLAVLEVVGARGRSREHLVRRTGGDRVRGRTGRERGARGVLVHDAGDGRDADLAELLVVGRSGGNGENRATSDLEKDLSRLQLHERAGHPTLDEVLVLVVVDVEVVEHVDLATAVRTDVVVVRVHEDSDDVGVLLEDLDRDDLRHAEFRGELFQVAVEATPHTVLEKEAVGDVVLGREEDGLTRAAVELAVLDDGRDDLIERRVRVVDVDVHAVGVELVVGRDGPDALLVDLVLVRDVTTVADENRTRDFLVQHETHLGLEPHDDVEVGDVHDVIAVQPCNQ
jgi:hypothetical protein